MLDATTRRRVLRSGLLRVAWFDVALFHRRPRLLLAFIGAMLVPALYATIYLTSAWDPYGHLDRLHVVIANADEGIEVRGEHVNVGERIVAGLLKTHTFDYEVVADEATARARVDSGEAIFAIAVPKDFSRHAVPATEQHPGRVRILFSEGNNFMGATIARRFANELATNTNATLNEQRWRVVLETVDTSKGSVVRLREGVAQLVAGSAQLDEGLQKALDGSAALNTGAHTAANGAVQLKDGTAKLADGAIALTDGVSRLGGGLRTLDAALPSASTLAPLTQGARDVAAGNAALVGGLSQLQTGAHTAKEGAGTLADKTESIPVVGGKIADGARQLRDGLQRLEDGNAKAHDGAVKLAAGSSKVADGVGSLVDGVQRAHGGVHEMATKVPGDETLHTLANGARAVATGNAALAAGLGQLNDGTGKLVDGMQALKDGSGRLHAGLSLLQTSLPGDVAGIDGDARGLASSVTPELIATTTVGAYGNSVAPYFIGLSLWVGVVMTGFIFQLRWMVEGVRRRGRFARVLGRLVVPGTMVVGQATLLAFTLRYVVGVAMPSLPVIWLLTVVTSLTFMSVLLCLVAVFGDVGKVLALLLLIFQMSASSGVFPVELSGGVFRAVSQFLPFTWVVRAARAALFGAFGGNWWMPLGVIASSGVVAIVIASVVGRFKYVPRHQLRPLLDVT